MSFIEVKAGGSNIPDNVYTLQLNAISDPKTVTAQRGPKAGQDIDLLDWTFVVSDPGSQFDGEEITESTSTASGPKSKMYAWITALLGGQPPAVGTRFEKSDLIGRLALGTIRKDESGWPRIANLGAIPASMLGQRVAAATGAPTGGTVAEAAPPAPQPIAAAAQAVPGQFAGATPVAIGQPTGDLPF